MQIQKLHNKTKSELKLFTVKKWDNQICSLFIATPLKWVCAQPGCWGACSAVWHSCFSASSHCSLYASSVTAKMEATSLGYNERGMFKYSCKTLWQLLIDQIIKNSNQHLFQAMHWWLLARGAGGWQHCDSQWDRDSWLLNPVTQMLWLSIRKYYKKYRLCHRSRCFLTHMVSSPALSPVEDFLPILYTEVVLTQRCGQDTRAQTGRLG